VRAYLLHLTHYDPSWCRRKAWERPFSLRLALEAVDAMAAAGYTTLVVDCEDAVRYESHPELARPYTAPMRDLATLARHAHQRGLDVVPKINFSQSHWHCHNHWFRPHHLLFERSADALDLERLPPGVRVLGEGPLSDQVVVSIALVSRGRARPDSHRRAMPHDVANGAAAADGLGPRRAALATARAWRLDGADASSTGQADGHTSV
jgi:hypothetical protein